MPAFWVKFQGHAPGCVEVDVDDPDIAMVAARLAAGREPVSAARLPYPAEPRIVRKLYTDPNGNGYHIPSFCYSPRHCAGQTLCPHRHSCVD